MVSIDSQLAASIMPSPGLDVHEGASHLAISGTAHPDADMGIEHHSH
jgi:hypothetical protein